MRYAVLADIHANLEAFKAVLEHAGPVEQYWCLGDIVGYGPQPNECIELLRSLNFISVAGNHDLAAIGRRPLDDFNPEARAAAEWTARQLTEESREFLAGLPQREVVDRFTLVHGSPRDPIDEYLLKEWDARWNFLEFVTQVCLVGHTHIPLIFEQVQETGTVPAVRTLIPQEREPVRLDRRRLIVNPGSVGQPRDGSPDASYMVYDSDAGTLQLHRVPYDVRAVQQKIIAAGLPARVATRLAYGM